MRKKRKRLPKPKNTENQYTLAPLVAAGLVTEEFSKHRPGLHDQSTHGNRIGGHWGGSHSGSSNITGMAAKMMKSEGFRLHESGNDKETKLSARTVLRGVRDSPGEKDQHYSGHVMSVEKANHTVGDKLEIPAMAVSGGRDVAAGYARRRDSDLGKHYVLYRFPPGTKMKGYQKNPAELRNDESGDWDYKWDEAIVSGRFHVTKVHKEYEGHYSHDQQKTVKYPVTVYTLSQDEVFDPDTGEWVKGGTVSKGTVFAYMDRQDFAIDRVSIVKSFWDESRHPRIPGGHHGGGEFLNAGGIGHELAGGRSAHNISPFPDHVKPKTTVRRATGAAKKAVPAVPKTAAPKTRTPPLKSVRAPKAVVSAAPKLVRGTPAVSSSSGLYDHKAKNINDKKLIPRINRGGTHIMYKDDENKKPLVASPISDPGKAYYARNADPKTKITNERLKEIFENPEKMTPSEKKMVSSAGGAKALDGTDTIPVETSRGERHLERYAVFGQLRSKIAPGSGDRTATRLDEDKRGKLAAKRRASGKVSSAEFGKIEKKITEDWSTDGGKTVPCVFCHTNLPPQAMSIETPKPKALGGGYKDRGGVWPAHADCNTKAGEYAQKDPLAYQEQMMKQFLKLPTATKKRLPFVYDFFPQLGKYPGTAADHAKHTKGGAR